jgi:hypothetical protein
MRRNFDRDICVVPKRVEADPTSSSSICLPFLGATRDLLPRRLSRVARPSSTSPAGKMNHIHMKIKGGGTATMAAVVPAEVARSYPELGGYIKCFSTAVPACGLVARHAKNINVRKFSLECIRPDHRPAAWLQNIEKGTISLESASGILCGQLFRFLENVRNTCVGSPGEPPRRPSHGSKSE